MKRGTYHGDDNSPARRKARKEQKRLDNCAITVMEERRRAADKNRKARQKATRQARPNLQGDVKDYLTKNPEPLCKRFSLSENEDE